MPIVSHDDVTSTSLILVFWTGCFLLDSQECRVVILLENLEEWQCYWPRKTVARA